MYKENYSYWEGVSKRQKEMANFKRESIHRLLEYVDDKTLSLIYEIIIRLVSL